jgi:hypothetical protein
MKAKLEFNLPEDSVEFEMVTNAGKMHSVIWDMNQWLRGKIKYVPDDMSDDKYEAYSEYREMLIKLITENNINLDI